MTVVTRLPTQGKRHFRILALDGGGVRAVMSLVILERLEQQLGVPLHEWFDLIAGVSVGSIVACGIGQGRTAKEAAEVFETEIVEPFRRTTGIGCLPQYWRFIRGQGKYSGANLSASLQRILGDMIYGDLHPTILCVGYDLVKRDLIAFRSDNERHQPLYAWEVATASASAPVLFPHHVMRYSDHAEAHLADGGLVTNNPALIALTSSRVEIGQVLMVSVGTGAVRERRRNIRTLAGHADNLLDAMFYGGTNATHRMIHDLLGNRLVRLQPPIESELIPLDRTQNIHHLRAVATEYLRRDGDRLIDRFVERFAGDARQEELPEVKAL